MLVVCLLCFLLVCLHNPITLHRVKIDRPWIIGVIVKKKEIAAVGSMSLFPHSSLDSFSVLSGDYLLYLYILQYIILYHLKYIWIKKGQFRCRTGTNPPTSHLASAWHLMKGTSGGRGGSPLLITKGCNTEAECCCSEMLWMILGGSLQKLFKLLQ